MKKTKADGARKNKWAVKLGRLGGLAGKKKYGRGKFVEMARKRWDKKLDGAGELNKVQAKTG